MRNPEHLTANVTPHFLAGVEVGKLQTATAEHNSETLSLGEPPPRRDSLGVEVSRWVGTRAKFYLWDIPLLSVGHILVYAVLFFVPLFLAYQLKLWRTDWWKANLPTFENPLVLPEIATFFSTPEALICGLIFLIAWFYLLNWIDIFWIIHYGAGRPGILVVPTWIKYSQQSSRYEKLRRIDGESLHFGLLCVWYGFNKDAFFVREQADHAAMVVDFSMITNVYVDHSSHDDGWVGNHGTPPVRIEFDKGRNKTTLSIHGAYFERNRNGTVRAEEFAEKLMAAAASKKQGSTDSAAKDPAKTAH